MGILEQQGKRLYRPTRQTDPGTDATAALPCCRAAALLPCCAVAHPPISAWKASEERASRGRNPLFTPTLPAPTRSSHTTSCTGMQPAPNDPKATVHWPIGWGMIHTPTFRNTHNFRTM